MKTLKNPIVPQAGLREVFREAFETQGNVLVEPVFASVVNEEERRTPAKILVICNHPESRSVLRKELQAAHYDVITAENETEGVNLAATVRPDLVLLDVKIPLMDGAWSSERLKNNSPIRPIPLMIILTDGDGEEEITAGLGLGLVDYVVKPYRPKELLSRIRKALTLQEEQRKFYVDVQAFKNNFIALASNELRNHVTVIAGFAALLDQKAGGLTAPVCRDYLQEIIQHADHLADLTDGFECLFHARGMVEKVDLFRAVTAAVQMMCPMIDKKDQSLILKPPQSDAVTIQGYSRELIIAIRHLLSYVHRYTTPGGTIGVEIFSNDQQGRIEVTTPDLVISQEREDQVSVVGELDLSLAITQWVAEQLGGSIGLESHPDRGRCFWVSLPLQYRGHELGEPSWDKL